MRKVIDQTEIFKVFLFHRYFYIEKTSSPNHNGIELLKRFEVSFLSKELKVKEKTLSYVRYDN